MATSLALAAPAGSGARRPPVLRITIRGIRLATGLVLFAYVLTHLVNHALGNVSLAAMEWGLGWAAALWWTVPGKAALYGATAIHVALGLWALYRRRPFRTRAIELAQLASGLLIPLLLLLHVIGTRGAFELHGTSKGYAQVLSVFFVEAPGHGILQAVALVVVWLHGIIGLHLWLRLKPWYGRVAAALAAFALLLPVLALLGYAQGGREAVRLAADPAWRELNLGPDSLGSPAENAELLRIRDRAAAGYLALVGLALAGRLGRGAIERRRGLLAVSYPDGQRVKVPVGLSVLEASRFGRVPHASVCGGRGRCSTCRVRVLESADDLPGPSAAEAAVLDRVRAGAGVRLACQLRPSGDVVVAPLLAPGITAAQIRDLDSAAFGEEHFVVAMFVDMRGSTRLAERRLPFDTVFVVNRFLQAVAGGVTAARGQPNQFLGDGLMALFGLSGPPDAAARQGLDAIRLIGENVAALNATLGTHLDEPIRFGIGLHAGTAILGEIGDRASGRAVFTAIGDPVNVAARLQSMTKRLGVEALVSDAVFTAAGIAPDEIASDLPREEVAIEGRKGSLWVRPLATASQPWQARVPEKA